MRISFSNVRCYHSPSLLGLPVSRRMSRVTDTLYHHIQSCNKLESFNFQCTNLHLKYSDYTLHYLATEY
jgi:hypothetical protein